MITLSLNAKRFAAALGGLGLLVSSGLVAEAQYYQPAPRYYPAPQYQPQPYGGPRRHYDDYRGQPGYYQSPRPRRAAYGSVCVTSRGECSVGRMVPIGTGCKCQIPGFGRKRGHVQY